jgi:hypothetical protein
MSTDANNLLSAFDSLNPAEQQLVAAEILRRTAGSDELAGETLEGLAAEVFQIYDAEESGGAKP